MFDRNPRGPSREQLIEREVRRLRIESGEICPGCGSKMKAGVCPNSDYGPHKTGEEIRQQFAADVQRRLQQVRDNEIREQEIRKKNDERCKRQWGEEVARREKRKLDEFKSMLARVKAEEENEQTDRDIS